MPTISYFFGIAIRMYLNDHSPAHFHAVYGNFEATFLVETGDLLDGRMPPAAQRLIKEWALIHRDALIKNWYYARSGQPVEKIRGLDVE